MKKKCEQPSKAVFYGRKKAWNYCIFLKKKFGVDRYVYRCRGCRHFHLTSQPATPPPYISSQLKAIGIKYPSNLKQRIKGRLILWIQNW